MLVPFVLFLVLVIYSSTQLCRADEFSKLENLLNKEDQPQDWRGGNSASYHPPPPVTPTPQAFNPTRNSYLRQGMPYSSESISALQHSAIWKYMSHPSFAGMNAAASEPASAANPFNLSPFGMLHYMWDDTTYVSAANPVTLYQAQTQLQAAQHYSRMAQAASRRVRYAANAEQKAEAVQQARYYAGLAQQAAQQAKMESESGSLNPAEVAKAAGQEAMQAQNYARQASSYAAKGY